MSADLGDVPTWIGGVSAFLALGAAVLAARWTAKTAKAAELQVDEIRKQVAADLGQLELAREDADRQVRALQEAEERAKRTEARALAAEERERAASEAAEERFIKAQLDTRAPAVYVRAMPGGRAPNSAADALPSLGYLDRIAPIDWNSVPVKVDSVMHLESTQNYLFVRHVSFALVNCSNISARVDILRHSVGEFVGMRSGQEIILPPSETRYVEWRGFIHSDDLRMAGVSKPENCFLQVEFWVRDLGMNVRDSHLFNLDLRYFENDGSRLVVKPEPAYPWTEKYGEVAERHYERLEAQKAKAEEGANQ
ncbi:hypothetical protein [Amycolatopsis sp. lyj-346]|uniref:hypothetical protein n=1 Tax=Amycolatopsis sp. lyj-346 TaxID=2789289 RepID=UPI00397DC883